MNNLKVWAAGGLLLTAGIIAACSSEDEVRGGQSGFQVRLTDAPGDYEAVWIDVEDVLIKRDADTAGEGGWESLPGVQRGVYNLLELVDGRDTMLVDAVIPSGTIHQLRLVLGEDNWITVNGEDIALTTPSAQQSGLKLKINADVNPGIVYGLVLDFDVAKSIVKAGNSGKYILKPVIRTFLDAQGGNLAGDVWPDTVQTAVLAIADGDTVSTYTSEDGGFLFRSLNPGSYQLRFLPDTLSGFLPYDTAGVIVEEGKLTDIGTITFTE
ncbi:DUF4382 domain-containing protein [Anseongella ginsenosidimutans]|nr:DUF4382 domain-containing protein [Anseongella ginsenosidimutans]QEC51455.1 DUF4382 domain-containing protein [Anseongella ginsenosidimutans]